MRFFSRFKSYILVRNHHIKKITFDERMGHGKSKTIEPMTCRNIKLQMDQGRWDQLALNEN